MENAKTKTKRGFPLFWKIHNFFNGDTRGLTKFARAEEAYEKRPRRWIMNVTFIALFLLVLVYMNYDVRIANAFDRPITSQAGDNLKAFFSFDAAYFFGYGYYEFKQGVVYGCLQTFALAMIGTTIGFALSFPFGLLASHKLFGKSAYINEIILILIRTFPEILLALFLTKLSGMNSLTAILALSLHSIGMIGKLFADQVDEADLESLEALDAAGANGFQRVHLAVMPEVLPNFISVGLYRFDINIRTATTLGLIISDGAGVGWLVEQDLSKNNYTNLGCDTLGIVILIIIVDLFSSYLRKKLV